MLKNLKKSDIQVTPFIANKSWEAVNTSKNSNDLIVIEQDTSISIALDFVDYGDGLVTPYINRNCNISVEPQSGDEIVIVDDGERGSGYFYPNSESKTVNGKYKRLVYQEIKNMFYNSYKDPTKIWGSEHIDFPKSKIKRFLADKFRVFSIPRNYFGEKLVEKSIKLTDNSLDVTYEIEDDGFGNLIAKKNLFSKIQEVRKFLSNISTGHDGTCDTSIDGSAGSAGYALATCDPW